VALSPGLAQVEAEWTRALRIQDASPNRNILPTIADSGGTFYSQLLTLNPSNSSPTIVTSVDYAENQITTLMALALLK
jgi:hypothetical protein